MLGNDINWAAFNIIEVMSSTKFTYKVTLSVTSRIGDRDRVVENRLSGGGAELPRADGRADADDESYSEGMRQSLSSLSLPRQQRGVTAA